jgi:hypothetical protein
LQDDNNEIIDEDPDESKLSYVPELHSTKGTPAYVYDGKFWDVPKNYKFQKNPTRKLGWEYWIRGKPGHEVLVDGVMKKAPIKPFHKLITDCLPESEQNVYGSTWKPIFKLMEQTPDLVIPSDLKEIDDDFINKSFDEATKFLQQRVSYIWELPNRNLLNWTISTWSKHVSHGFIFKLGNENDKQYLPPDYVPKKRNRAGTGAAAAPVNNNNNNQNNNNNRDVSQTARRTQQRNQGKHTNTAGTRSVADMFAATFQPNPVYLEQAKTTTNNDTEVIDIDE